MICFDCARGRSVSSNCTHCLSLKNDTLRARALAGMKKGADEERVISDKLFVGPNESAPYDMSWVTRTNVKPDRVRRWDSVGPIPPP